MNQVSWSLFNIKSLQKQSKKLYISPSKQSIFRHISKGNYFQLMFRSNNHRAKFIAVEKLWCQFQTRRHGVYFGELVSIPKIIHSLQFGEQIPFCAEHILACMSQEKAQRNFSLNKTRNRAQLSQDLLTNSNIAVQWVREMPVDSKDTGWRLIAKDQECLDKPTDFNSFQLGQSNSWEKILCGTIGASLETTSTKVSFI